MKRIYLIVILICSILLYAFSSLAAYDISSDILKHKKFLYIFDPDNSTSLEKTIDRSGIYELHALVKPKIEPNENKYIYNLDVNASNVSESCSCKIDKGHIEIYIPANSPEKTIELVSGDLNIDTSIYPYFELNYDKKHALIINLYFYIDIDNNDTVDFLAYYGKEPSQEIKKGLKAYPLNYYIKHVTVGEDKGVRTDLYGEVRIHRTDRIFFQLKKLYVVLEGEEKEVVASINELNLYNKEQVQESIFVKSYEAAEEKQATDLYDYVIKKGDFNKALDAPLFRLKSKSYFLSELDKITISKTLKKRSEIDFGVLKLNKDDRLDVEFFENEFFDVEAVILAEVLKEDNSEPELSIEKVNPTRYIADARASSSFWITLNENYHSGWRAYIVMDGSDVGSERYALEFAMAAKDKLIPLQQHKIVNAYANGWFVPVAEIFKGSDKPVNFRIVMEFYPQRFYEVGMLISGFSFAIILLYLVVYGLKKVIRK